MYKILLKYLKKYHIGIYNMMIDESLKNNDRRFFYDNKTKKLFEYSLADIQDYYQQKKLVFDENPFKNMLVTTYIYNTNNFVKVYHSYNNFLSIKKMKKLLNEEIWYKKEIKKELYDDFKTADKKKRNIIAKILYNL